MLYDLVKAAVKDTSGKLDDPTDYDNAITAALKRYSRHRPRVLVADLPGTGSNDLALPASWSDGHSGVQGVEYPVGNIPEEMIDQRDYKLYQTPTGQKLRLLTVKPTVSEAVRLTFTGLHIDESTVAVADQEAVANLAASICCRALAAYYGNTGDPTIQADVVNYRSKTDEYRRLADSFESLYNDHLGIRPDDTTPAAMATAAPADSGRVRLTHGRR